MPTMSGMDKNPSPKPKGHFAATVEVMANRVRPFAVKAWPFLLDRLRAASLLLVYFAAFWLMHVFAPQFAREKNFALAFIAARLALGAFQGYWCDRILFPDSRPRTLKGIERGAAEKRRALIVAAHVIASGINL